MPEVGDRVEVQSKAGVRMGRVTRVSGAMVSVEWDTGGQTTVIPAPGVMSVVSGGRPTTKAPAVKKAPAAKKAPAKKAPPPKKAPVKKAPVKKAPGKKAPAKKAPVKKAAPAKQKKGTAKKTAAKKKRR
ncbi:MAG: hypothetical protein JOZ04_08880 [Acidimicrobiia bacterium]|nr:hypothetical protein [Acidimicrobiia bacterium]